MAREFAIEIYLFFFRFLFTICNMFPTKRKTTFIVSFSGNVQVTMEELERLVDDQQIVVLQAPGCTMDFQKGNRIVLSVNPKNLMQFIRAIYHLATSSHVIVDNYYGFLAVSRFKKDVVCVQLWHAAGAIKKFGLEDLTNELRSKRALQRFQAVYNRFDHVVVGSDRMIDIFKKSFGLPEERFIKTGIPRTDFFYNQLEMHHAKTTMEELFPIIKDKKVLLFAPTYRDGAFHATDLHLDIDKLYAEFKYEYVLFLRLHPAVVGELENKYPGFIYNVSNYPDINHLLVAADVLITDYSSIPFEFSLLNKPMIFYAYDFEAYGQDRGIWEDYAEQVPGPVVMSTEELMHTIRERDYHMEKVQDFAEEWNKYNQGHASEHLVQALYDLESVEVDRKVREHA